MRVPFANRWFPRGLICIDFAVESQYFVMNRPPLIDFNSFSQGIPVHPLSTSFRLGVMLPLSTVSSIGSIAYETSSSHPHSPTPLQSPSTQSPLPATPVSLVTASPITSSPPSHGSTIATTLAISTTSCSPPVTSEVLTKSANSIVAPRDS